MKQAAFAVSLAALLLVIGPPILFMTGAMGEGLMKAVMLAGTVIWFIAWPMANRESSSSADG